MKTESEDTIKYALCSIKWKDSGEIEDGCIFKLSLDLDEQDEDRIFYYCEDSIDLERLTKENNGEDFTVIDIQYIRELDTEEL